MTDRSDVVKNYIEAACKQAEAALALYDATTDGNDGQFNVWEAAADALDEFRVARDAYLALPERG